jgi:hypothetical protein
MLTVQLQLPPKLLVFLPCDSICHLFNTWTRHWTKQITCLYSFHLGLTVYVRYLVKYLLLSLFFSCENRDSRKITCSRSYSQYSNSSLFSSTYLSIYTFVDGTYINSHAIFVLSIIWCILFLNSSSK